MNTFGALPTSSTAYGGNFQAAYIAPPLLYWYYPLNGAQVNILTLNPVVNGMKTALDSLSNNLNDAPYTEETQATGPYTPLLIYQNYISVLLVPTVGLTALLLSLMLYVEGAMMYLLIEQRASSIATLRSRGASIRQVLNLYIVQAVGLVLVAFVIGPGLALLAVYLLVQTTLPIQDQGTTSLLSTEPGTIALQLLASALVAAIIALLAIVAALYHATRSNILVLRREFGTLYCCSFLEKSKA